MIIGVQEPYFAKVQRHHLKTIKAILACYYPSSGHCNEKGWWVWVTGSFTTFMFSVLILGTLQEVI